MQKKYPEYHLVLAGNTPTKEKLDDSKAIQTSISKNGLGLSPFAFLSSNFPRSSTSLGTRILQFPPKLDVILIFLIFNFKK